MKQWKANIDEFIALSNKHKVRMLMVGGGAVNFHGYQRHSADVDFWLDTSKENFLKLIRVFNDMGYKIDDFPLKVKNGQQNISIKFSPVDIDLELITNFSVNKPFDQVYKESETVFFKDEPNLKWKILSLENLITSKIKSGRPKDLLDIQELKRINNLK